MGVGGEGVLGLGDADREMTVTLLLQLGEAAAQLGVGNDVAAPVDLTHDGLHLGQELGLIRVEQMEVTVTGLSLRDDLAGESLRPTAAMCPGL